MKKLFFLIIFISLASNISAETLFTVTTGFGYFLDSDNHIYCKATLPQGQHPIKDEYAYVEVADKNALDLIEVYVEPPIQIEIYEKKIKNKIAENERKDAIKDLKNTGELPADYE